MPRLWQDFGIKNIGPDLDDIFAITSERVGYDLSPQMSTLLNSKPSVPLQPLLENVGIKPPAFASKVDKPFVRETSDHQPYLGITIKAANMG